MIRTAFILALVFGALASIANAQGQEQTALPTPSVPLSSRTGYDPSRVATVGLWPGQPVSCKLPKRQEPYSCRRVLEGPLVILSPLPYGEIFVARGDAAAARGERSYWLHGFLPTPLALAAGEVLYVVGSTDGGMLEGDRAATVYR